MTDPVLEQIRAQISDTDRAILERVNARLELVAQIKAYKDSQGIAFLDPEREQTMLRELARANSGRLSDEGLRELFGTILDLTKREVGGGQTF